MSVQYTDLGPEWADEDPNLLSYYHATDQVQSLLGAHHPDNPSILVAPPGSGKTALFRWLTEGDHEFNVLSVNADNFDPPLDSDSLSNLSITDVKLIIRYELSKSALQKWLELNPSGEGSPPGVESIHRAYNRRTSSISKRITNMLGREVTGVGVSGFFVNLAPAERKPYLQALRNSGDAEFMEEQLQKAATTERPLIVAVDNPEQIVAPSLDAMEKRNALLTGALLHVLQGLQIKGVRVLTLTRDNVFVLVKSHYPDYGQFSRAFTWLAWTSDDLIGVIAERVDKRLQQRWDDTFALTKETFKQEVIPLVVDGPRDLILLCNYAREIESARVADLSHFRQSVDSLLDHKLTAINSHYDTQYPRIREYIEAAAGEVAVKFGDEDIDKEELRKCIVNKSLVSPSRLFSLSEQQEWIQAMQARKGQIESFLYDVGVIGVIDATGRRYAWTGRSPNRINTARRVFLSPLFQRLGE